MKSLLFVVCLGLAVGTGTAHAALISANDPVYGIGSITQDTGTGLEWLDLTESTGFSVNDILGGAGGFLANGFAVATLVQVETMFTNGGWDGVDDSANSGSAGHLAFVLSMQSLFGVTGTSGASGESLFNEGYALSALPGLVARPFNTISQFGAAGRVACTTSGFNTFTNVNTFDGCRMDLDQHYGFIGTYLVRSTAVPEPATLLLFGSGLAIAAVRRRKKNR